MHAINRRWYWLARQWIPCCNVYSIALLLMVLCMFLLLVNIYELRLMQVDHAVLHNVPLEVQNVDGRDSLESKPVVWIHGKHLEHGYLQHVFDIFGRLGYKTDNSTSDWDVLWSHPYPFRTMSKDLANLRPHQKVNHFPGTAAITNKVDLVMSAFDFIPKAFQMPDQKENFLNYVKKNPEKQWLQKSNSHRGIKILSVEELDLDASNAFVQEFLEDTLIIDKRRFDIGVYATLTSVEPLRAFTYHGDWLLRFCIKDYFPFDRNDVDKYVISDDYTPVWEVDSLAKFYTELGGTRRSAFFAYLRSIGKDPNILSERLDAAIHDVFYAKETFIIHQSSRFAYRNFFEMMRFDFLVDEDLNVYLLEVNMSPNLSSDHFIGNRLLYEQVIFSLLKLVGIASPTDAKKRSLHSLNAFQVYI